MLPLALLFFASCTASAVDPPALTCETLPALTGAMVGGHYQHATIGPLARGRTAEQVIGSLDPGKTLLLQSDVDELTRELEAISVTGDCRVLESAGKKVVDRAAKDAKTVAEMLGPHYVLDESVSLILDSDERPWPKTEGERALRRAATIHFQISSQLLGGATLDEAKKTVGHRYELLAKRLSERRSPERLPELYAQAFARSLDPHSSFLTAKDLADFEIAMSLHLEGIGAVLRYKEGITVVQSVVAGGAADKQGELRAGDRIMAVAQDGEDVISAIDMDMGDVVGMIRGKKGTIVHLTIEHEKDAKPVIIEIERDTIDVGEQAAKITYETRQDGDRTITIGVLDLPSFYGDEKRTSFDDVKELLAEATQKGVDGLVIDLSSNGGGRLDDAVSISGLFVHLGAIVGTSDGESPTEVLKDRRPGTSYSGPLVVLISSASASASEILAGALQDYDRAVIVGSKQTFGKGTVQQLSGLPAGMGALKLTKSMFFRPSGASTQNIGVSSDILIPSAYDGYDINEANMDYALPPSSLPPFMSSNVQNVKTDAAWTVITDDTIAMLSKRSAARIAENPVMALLTAELAEDDEETTGPMLLADLRKEAEDAEDDDTLSDRFDQRDAALIAEAVDIAADLSGRVSLVPAPTGLQAATETPSVLPVEKTD